MIWRHIDFWFYCRDWEREEPIYLNADNQFQFELFIADIIKTLALFIRRKFYLYEPQPNLFLAIEIRSVLFIPFINIALFFLRKKKPPFISGVYLKSKHIKTEGDECNGEGFLDIMNAATDYYLFKKDCKLTHLIHCLLEFQYQSRGKEISFYKEMLKLYEPKKEKQKKKRTNKIYSTDPDVILCNDKR